MSFDLHLEDARRRVAERANAVEAVSRAGESAAELAPSDLLWWPSFGCGEELDSQVLLASRRAKQARFGGAVFAVVPLYVTSICVERCIYCNYRAGNHGVELERRRLTLGDLRDEVHYLAGQKGLRTIELVYATDPQVRVDRMCADVETVQGALAQYGGGTVGINAEALDEGEYGRLRDAGVNFVVLWQETYDRVEYARCHPGATKKTRIEYRIDAFERMLSAGIRSFGMGVLSGLSGWRTDWALLLEHEKYLQQAHGIGPAILGIPRLKPAAGALLQKTSVVPSDQEFRCAVAIHNLASPATLPFLNTRENWDLCEEMAAGGGALFTFNCSTIPGGYSQGSRGYQFPTRSFDAPAFAPRLAQSGLLPVFDWRLEGQSVSITERPPATAARL